MWQPPRRPWQPPTPWPPGTEAAGLRLGPPAARSRCPPPAPTLLADQRLRLSAQTLQVAVAALLVLLQRALLLVAAAAVVALVGFANGGRRDCKTHG